MSILRQLASVLRAGLARANTPVVPPNADSHFLQTWLNEATLVGISVPLPRSNR